MNPSLVFSAQFSALLFWFFFPRAFSNTDSRTIYITTTDRYILFSNNASSSTLSYRKGLNCCGFFCHCITAEDHNEVFVQYDPKNHCSKFILPRLEYHGMELSLYIITSAVSNCMWLCHSAFLSNGSRLPSPVLSTMYRSTSLASPEAVFLMGFGFIQVYYYFFCESFINIFNFIKVCPDPYCRLSRQFHSVMIGIIITLQKFNT